MLTWETLENVYSGHDLYFDLFGWVEVGQIVQPWSLKGYSLSNLPTDKTRCHISNQVSKSHPTSLWLTCQTKLSSKIRRKSWQVLFTESLSRKMFLKLRIHVKFSHNGNTPFHLWSEGLVRTFAESQQSDQNVLFWVLVGKKCLPAAICKVVPSNQLNLVNE